MAALLENSLSGNLGYRGWSWYQCCTVPRRDDFLGRLRYLANLQCRWGYFWRTIILAALIRGPDGTKPRQAHWGLDSSLNTLLYTPASAVLYLMDPGTVGG